MTPESSPPRSRRAPALLALLCLAAGILIVATVDRSPGAKPTLPVHGGADGHSPTPGHAAQELGAIPEPAADDARAVQPAEKDDPVSLRCVRRENGSGLPGIRVYVGAEAIGKASDADGILAPPAGVSGGLTLWAAGWRPVQVSGSALPARVAFDAASGSLEMRLENGTYEHRVLKSQIQSHAPDAGSAGPWTPKFEERAPELWIAERVPAGTYDVYFWVVFPDGEPRSFSQRGIEIGTQEPSRLTIDLAAARDPEQLESDS